MPRAAELGDQRRDRVGRRGDDGEIGRDRQAGHVLVGHDAVHGGGARIDRQTGPAKPACVRLRISAAPTECGLSDAPITATERGRNIRSRLRIDMAAFKPFESCRRPGDPSRRARLGVCLHVACHAVGLILQLPPRPLERIVEREAQVGVALVGLRRPPDIDLAAFRQSEPDIDLVESAVAMMPAGGLQHDAARGDAAEAFLELGDMANRRPRADRPLSRNPGNQAGRGSPWIGSIFCEPMVSLSRVPAGNIDLAQRQRLHCRV